MKYSVVLRGSIPIEANNPQEAEEKAKEFMQNYWPYFGYEVRCELGWHSAKEVCTCVIVPGVNVASR